MYSRLTQIDVSMLSHHYYLDVNDSCHFMGEYTAKEGYGYSDTNQLIYNFKKEMDRQGRPEWVYKTRAINTVGVSLNNCLGSWAADMTFVPIPPSKCKSDPMYDDRLVQSLEYFKSLNANVDYREIITQPISIPSAHDNNRLTPDEYADQYEVDTGLITGVRRQIMIVDDVVTTGSHYKAVHRILRQHFPAHEIYGIFVARRVPGSIDISQLFDLTQ